MINIRYDSELGCFCNMATVIRHNKGNHCTSSYWEKWLKTLGICLHSMPPEFQPHIWVILYPSFVIVFLSVGIELWHWWRSRTVVPIPGPGGSPTLLILGCVYTYPDAFQNALHPHQRFQEFTKVSHPHWMLEDFLNLLTGRVKRHESSLGWYREARHNTFLMLFLWYDHFVSKISQHLLLRSGQVTVPCVSKGAFTFALIACSGRGFDCSPFPARLCSFYMMCVRTRSRLHNQSATYVARERLWGKH